MKAFAAAGVHGTSVITCVTAQNPRRILAIQGCEPALVAQQLAAVFEELPPQAIKTGLLYSPEIIRVIAAFLRRHKRIPLVVDPVAIATSGRRLLPRKAEAALQGELLPMATLATPNLHEAEMLTGRPIREPEEMRWAARFIQARFGCAVLVKGGHLKGVREAVDIFYDGREELMLAAPFIKGVSLHGAGCTYSAAITGFLAQGCALLEALERGKKYITRAIARSATAAGHAVLACDAGNRSREHGVSKRATMRRTE